MQTITIFFFYSGHKGNFVNHIQLKITHLYSNYPLNVTVVNCVLQCHYV